MKYIAKELDIESFDCEVYFNEDEAIYNSMWIGENRDFITMNADFFDDIMTAIEDCNADINTELEEADLEVDFDNLELAKASIDYYFLPLRTLDNIGNFTDDEYKQLYKLCFDDKKTNIELVVEARSIIHRKPFQSGTFRGSCQRDWLYYICPEELSDDYLDYVESVLFGTGTEYLISDELIESVDDLDHNNGSTYYTCKFFDNDRKEDLARQIGCEVDELEVYNISSTKTIVQYEYKKV